MKTTVKDVTTIALHLPELPTPPSETRQWIWGFHFKSLPKVWRTQMNLGVKSSVLLSLWNNLKIAFWTAVKSKPSKERSSAKKWRSSSSIVKMQWRWLALMILKDIAVVRSIEYIVPQEGQNLLLHLKGTNFNLPHSVQPYKAPPNEGSPQLIILSMFSTIAWRGCKIYIISS